MVNVPPTGVPCKEDDAAFAQYDASKFPIKTIGLLFCVTVTVT